MIKKIVYNTLLFLCFLGAGSLKGGETNLALGKTCTVFSSLEDGNWGVKRLTDGKKDSGGWRSKAFSKHGEHQLYPEYIVIDLETNCQIKRVVMHPAEGGKGLPEDFSIQVCREGEPWQTVVSKQGFAAGAAQLSFELSGAEGRFVKVEATRLRKAGDEAYRFQLAEFEVWGESKASSALQPAKAIEEKIVFKGTLFKGTYSKGQTNCRKSSCHGIWQG